MKRTVTLSTIAFTGLLTSCGDVSETSNTTNNSSIKTQQAHTPTQTATMNIKFELFKDINNVRTKLSSVGIGQMTEWKFDEYDEYYSLTPYYSFGSGDLKRNNLAYYLNSKSPNYIQSLMLVVNINDGNKASSLKEFASIISKTYLVLGIKSNSQIINSAKKGVEIKVDNDDYTETIMLEQTKIETWKFIIETK